MDGRGRWRGDGEVGGLAVGDRHPAAGVAAARTARGAGGPAGADSTAVPADVSAEEQVLLGVEYGDLGAALGELSPEMRAVVQATVLDGLTTREAARLLGIPENTVKTRLHRAKAQLREDLTEGLT